MRCACPHVANADTGDVRRMAELIVIACALCVGPASAPAAPTPTPPSTAAVSIPMSSSGDPVAQAQAETQAGSPAETLSGTPSDTGLSEGSAGEMQQPVTPVFGETSYAPTSTTEAAISGAANPAPAPTASEFRHISARFAGLPDADSTPAAPPRPHLTIGEPIAVTTMHVVHDDKPSTALRRADCKMEVLHAKPAGKTREVGTLSVDGAPAQHEDILSLVRHRACEAGANAVLIKSMDKKRIEGVSVDHVEAVALVLGTPPPPADPSPVPKSITVTPEGPAVPKTITVDPGPAR